jgi:hypothetical protein
MNTYFSRISNVLFLCLVSFVFFMLGCGEEKSLSITSSQDKDILLSKPVGKTVSLLSAQVGVVVRQQNLPKGNVEVAFARSISGRATEYQWQGITDERGWVEIEINADTEVGLRTGVSGYYTAEVKDILSHEILGRWTSLPINAGTTQKIVLEIGEKPQVIYEEGFAVYIAVEGIHRFIDLNTIELLQPAFISASDIQTYRWSDHQISYSDSVWKRLQTWGSIAQRVFVVTVNGERLYWGLFLDILSSSGTHQPVIMLFLRNPDGRNTIPQHLLIGRGYPSNFDAEPDPRKDFRIYESLLKSKILVQ